MLIWISHVSFREAQTYNFIRQRHYIRKQAPLGVCILLWRESLYGKPSFRELLVIFVCVFELRFELCASQDLQNAT